MQKITRRIAIAFLYVKMDYIVDAEEVIWNQALYKKILILSFYGVDEGLPREDCRHFSWMHLKYIKVELYKNS